MNKGTDVLGAPSLISIVMIVASIAVIGVALDKLVLSSRLDAWRHKIRRLWIKLNTPGAQDLVQDANQLYRDLFDYIYGSQAFTRRRVSASILSSMIALVVFTLILGYENTLWPTVFGKTFARMFGEGTNWVFPIVLMLIPVLLNLIPDFFSLIETRLVLTWSKGRGSLRVLLLIILDLVLTSTIFVFGLFCMYTVEGGLRWGEWWAPSGFLAVLPSMITSADRELVFFLTTFVTSLFWILFVLTFAGIRIFHRLSPLANFVYYEIGRSDRPAAALSAFLNGIIIVVYLVWLLLGRIPAP